MSEIMAEANHQDLAMEQDPENVLLKEDEENEMDKETQEHVDNDLKTGDGVQAVAAELDKDADVELQEAEVVQVDDVQVHTAEVVQVTEMLQEDQVMQPDCEILPVGDEGHLGSGWRMASHSKVRLVIQCRFLVWRNLKRFLK